MRATPLFPTEAGTSRRLGRLPAQHEGGRDQLVQLGQMTYSPNAKDAINTLFHSTLHTSLVRFPYGPISNTNPTPALMKSSPYSSANTRIAGSPVQ